MPSHIDGHLRLGAGATARMVFWSTGVVAAGFLTIACKEPGAEAYRYHAKMVKAEFTRDRDNCRQVAEQTTPYVDPKNGKAVGERSYRVEGEIQKCMLNRGWNNPRFDGWKAGRN